MNTPAPHRILAGALPALIALLALTILIPTPHSDAAAPSAAHITARAATLMQATHDRGVAQMQALLARATPRINKQRNAYATGDELVKMISPLIGKLGNIEAAARRRMSAFEARALRQLAPFPAAAETARSFTEANDPLFESLESSAMTVRDALVDLATPITDPLGPPDREPEPAAPEPAPTPPGPPPGSEAN